MLAFRHSNKINKTYLTRYNIKKKNYLIHKIFVSMMKKYLSEKLPLKHNKCKQYRNYFYIIMVCQTLRYKLIRTGSVVYWLGCSPR